MKYNLNMGLIQQTKGIMSQELEKSISSATPEEEIILGSLKLDVIADAEEIKSIDEALAEWIDG